MRNHIARATTVAQSSPGLLASSTPSGATDQCNVRGSPFGRPPSPCRVRMSFVGDIVPACLRWIEVSGRTAGSFSRWGDTCPEVAKVDSKAQVRKVMGSDGKKGRKLLTLKFGLQVFCVNSSSGWMEACRANEQFRDAHRMPMTDLMCSKDLTKSLIMVRDLMQSL